MPGINKNTSIRQIPIRDFGEMAVMRVRLWPASQKQIQEQKRTRFLR